MVAAHSREWATGLQGTECWLTQQTGPAQGGRRTRADLCSVQLSGFEFMGASPAGRPNPECNPVQSRVLHAQLASPHFPLSSLPLS